MIARLANFKDRRRMESILLVCALVTMSMVVVLPLTVPTAKAQILHLNSASAEDGVSPYDTDFVANGIVVWDQSQDHQIPPNPMPGMPAYIIEAGYELRIPALNWQGNPAVTQEITFLPGAGARIEVETGATLTTQLGGPAGQFDKTLFWAGSGGVWEGINFLQGSSGTINDCAFLGSEFGVVYFYGSTMTGSGVANSVFQNMGQGGVTLDYIYGNKIIQNCNFQDTYSQSRAVYAKNTQDLTITTCTFDSHGNNMAQLHIEDANVSVENCYFIGGGDGGNEILIEGDSNGTVLDHCDVSQGSAGDPLVRAIGCTPLLNNCSLDVTGGARSVNASDSTTGVFANLILRNPAGDGSPGQLWDDSFDNTTMDVTGTSSVTLQWYLNVYVNDTDDNPIENSEVNVSNAVLPSIIKNTASVPPHSPGEEGWAKWIVVTELVKFSPITFNFNPYNVSAENDTIYGYAIPEPGLNMSIEITITVPFNPIPNTRPEVVWWTTPGGLQSGYVSVDFRLFDANEADNGTLWVDVHYSTDGTGFRPATLAPGSQYLNLNSGDQYTIIWDSRADEGNLYDDTVWIVIFPYDSGGSGTPVWIGSFVLDNEPPILQSGPTVDVTDTTAIINWTVHEPADAVVWYGLYVDGSVGDLTYEVSGTTGSTSQSVTLTNLQPGRKYSYMMNSTDPVGNKFNSAIFGFETQYHIQLYQGWNMISILPNVPNPLIEAVLAPIAGQFTAVQYYDPTDPDDPWKHYNPDKPSELNDLKVILPMMGVLIYMKNDAVFIPDQIVPDVDPPHQEIIPLVGGDWNIVGYPSVTARDPATALNDISGYYDMVQTYDAETGEWLYYDPSDPSSTLTLMEFGQGYWIHATADVDWNVSYI